MGLMDRNYPMVINLSSGSLITSSKISLFNTDRNIFNISVQLNKGVGKIKDLVTSDELPSYTVTLTVVKPKTKELVDIVGVQVPDTDILLFELPETFNSQIGKYHFEFKIEYGNEILTSSPGSYDVIGSIVTGLNSQIEDNPDIEVLRGLINEVKALAGLTIDDPDGVLGSITLDGLTTTNKTILGAINEHDGELDKIVNVTDATFKQAIINEVLDGVQPKYVTQAEYDALSDEQKNDPTIEYHITDAVHSNLNITFDETTGDLRIQ